MVRCCRYHSHVLDTGIFLRICWDSLSGKMNFFPHTDICVETNITVRILSRLLKLYQAFLSLQMMLLVSYNWSTRRFEESIEYRMHFIILMFVLVVALVPLFYQSYNPYYLTSGGRCMEVTLPLDCNNTTIECVRGDVTLEIVYHWLEISVTFLVTIFCTVAMIVIYRSVYNQEKRMARYNIIGDSDTEDRHRRSKHIRKSMILYTSSFYICWNLPVVLYLLFPDSASARIARHVLVSLMGFFNSLVFIMPKCIKYQKDHSGTGLLKAYSCVIFSSPIGLCTKLREDLASKRGNISSTRTVDLSETDTPLL